MSSTQFNTLRPLLVVAASIGSLMPLSAANLLVNGDFSGGTSGTHAPGSNTTNNAVPTGWTGFATGPDALKVPSNNVNFNGGDQVTGSYIEQVVSTTANRWYALDWDQTAHTGGDNTGVMMTSTLTSGGSSTTGAFRGLLSPQALILAGSTTTTIRLSDDGASTGSLDTRIDNANFDLANGQLNMAHLATLSSDSQLGGWDREENITDGRTGNASNTVFHNNSNNGWLDMDFTTNFSGASFNRIEIEARATFNSRKGDTIDIFSTSGSLIESIDISTNNDLLFGVDGTWDDVGRIRISESGQTLNIAEVRTFSTLVDGVVVVPEPASTSLLALGSITLLLRRRR